LALTLSLFLIPTPAIILLITFTLNLTSANKLTKGVDHVSNSLHECTDYETAGGGETQPECSTAVC